MVLTWLEPAWLFLTPHQGASVSIMMRSGGSIFATSALRDTLTHLKANFETKEITL